MPINQSVYFFGNSLVNYAEGGALTNVPVWMNRFAQFDNNSLAVNGGYGFLRNFADTPEPDTNWGFEGVRSVYDGERSSFAENTFDTVVITPSNFVQDRAPNQDYFDEARSPLEAARDVVSNLGETQPGAQIYIYQGWADMAQYSPDGSEPPASELAAYHDYNTGEYTDWFNEFTSGLQSSAPDANIQLIPIANVLSTLLSSQPLSEIPFDDLYVDSAPHGTETLYFLAGLTSYAAIYGTLPPADFPVPDNIHPAVAVNFDHVTEIIAETLGGFGFEVETPPTGRGEEFEIFEAEGQQPEQIQDEDDTAILQEEPEEEPVASEPQGEQTFWEGEDVLPALEDTGETEESARVGGSIEAEEDEAPTVTRDAEGFANFTRTIDVETPGAYLFELQSDDLATLMINGNPVLINQGDTPDASQNVTVELEAGENTVEVEYYQDGAGEVLILDMGPVGGEDAGKDDFPLPPVDFDDIPEEDEDEDYFA